MCLKLNIPSDSMKYFTTDLNKNICDIYDFCYVGDRVNH